MLLKMSEDSQFTTLTHENEVLKDNYAYISPKLFFWILNIRLERLFFESHSNFFSHL